MDKRYVVVTAISQYRMRYVVSLDDLQQCNTKNPVDPAWALDAVTCNDLEEFSQLWLGETIIDHDVVSEDKLLEIFDTDNDYLAKWPTEQKLNFINNLAEKIKKDK